MVGDRDYSSLRNHLLVLAGICLIAFNLRPIITSVPPVLETIRFDLEISHASVSLLTTVPILLMGACSLQAAWVSRRLGPEQGVFWSMIVLCMASVIRIQAELFWVLMLSAIVGGVAIAIGQTLLAGVMKRYFPDRAATVMGIYTSLMIAGAATACQDSPTDELLGEADASASEQEARAQVFQAQLRPLNSDVSHRPVKGQATVRVENGQFTVRVDAKGLEPGIPHPQHIHGKAGLAVGECPDMTADENDDGVIDVIEGVPDYGAVRLTLDGDLSDGPGTQVNSLPNPDNQGGAITYTASVSLEAVQNGVDDAFGGYELAPGKRHIVLHGVDPETDLSTAQSLGGLPAWLTLPVACGQLTRVGR
jgi:hypothetical protein